MQEELTEALIILLIVIAFMVMWNIAVRFRDENDNNHKNN